MSQISTKQSKNTTKDKRSWWLSHEAFLYLHALAEEQGLNIPQFLESLSRDLAKQRLPEDQRASIIAEAKRITSDRRAGTGQPEA